jgi:hypothetical protein
MDLLKTAAICVTKSLQIKRLVSLVQMILPVVQNIMAPICVPKVKAVQNTSIDRKSV